MTTTSLDVEVDVDVDLDDVYLNVRRFVIVRIILGIFVVVIFVIFAVIVIKFVDMQRRRTMILIFGRMIRMMHTCKGRQMDVVLFLFVLFRI